MIRAKPGLWFTMTTSERKNLEIGRRAIELLGEVYNKKPAKHIAEFLLWLRQFVAVVVVLVGKKQGKT